MIKKKWSSDFELGSFELKNSKIFKLILRTRVIEGHLGPNLKKKKGGPQIASSEAEAKNMS